MDKFDQLSCCINGMYASFIDSPPRSDFERGMERVLRIATEQAKRIASITQHGTTPNPCDRSDVQT